MEDEVTEEVLTSLRRIMRAIDLHSRDLVGGHGITMPQLLTLRKLGQLAPVTVGTLAREISVSQATVTGILDRLEIRGFAKRTRSESDKRKVMVEITEAGRDMLQRTPPVLQERFISEFRRLENWEQTLILSSLQRIVSMMEAGDIEAGPAVAMGPLNAGTEEGPGRVRERQSPTSSPESADSAVCRTEETATN